MNPCMYGYDRRATLLFEDRSEIAVRRRELGHESNGGDVAVDGFFDVSLLNHRIAQVVVCVRMVCLQMQCGAVRIDGFV